MTPVRCPNAFSSAKLFVQLSLRHQHQHQYQQQYPHHNPRPAAVQILDLFVPAAGAHYHHAAAPIRRQQQLNPTLARAPRAAPATIPSILLPSPPPAPSRRFSTTPSRRRTQALYNPQQDEDGKEMILEITPRAATRLSEIMTKDANPYLALRIQVESGGCHGFQYLMSLVTLPPSLPEKTGVQAGEIREDDTIFTFVAPEGETTTLEAPKIILDAPSLDLLKGSKVDFTMELIGSQFKIVDNPLATSSCGCGTSFDIKM